MELLIFGIILCLVSILSIWGCYLVLRPKIKQTQILDTETEVKNKELSAKAQELYNLILTYNEQENLAKTKIEMLKQNANDLKEQTERDAQFFYQKSLDLATERLDKSVEIEAEKYVQTLKNFQDKLNQDTAILQHSYDLAFQEQEQILLQKKAEINDLKKIVDAAVEAAKRAEEIKDNNKFYRIQLENWEAEEIAILRSISPKLRNDEPLNKVIWKCYYEKPTTDLIGRVIGSGVHTGIYKITNIDNQKCYIGQAVNLAERWKQHIKRGVGAEAPTRNKLYPAMFEAGPENFTFEIVEECDRSLLDSREDYWQDYFKAKEFGYSIK